METISSTEVNVLSGVVLPSDAELLARIGCYSGEGPIPNDVELAWGAFYQRHVGYLVEVARRDRTLSATGLADDAVQNAMLNAFERAKSYRPPLDEEPDLARRHVRAWLGTILRNVARDLYREATKRGKIPKQLSLTDERQRSLIDRRMGIDPPELSGPVLIISQLLRTMLDDRERDVLAAFADNYDPDSEQQQLSAEVQKALVVKWKATPENLRQIRKRALEKVKRLFEEAMEGGADAYPPLRTS